MAAHGSIALKLSNGVPAPAPKFTFYAAAASANTLAGGATPRAVNASVTVVGFVGQGGTLTFNNVDGGASGGVKLLSFDYINGDVVFSNTACSNCRNAFVSINGGAPVQAQMPISAQVRIRFLLALSTIGFDEMHGISIPLALPCFYFFLVVLFTFIRGSVRVLTFRAI